jgi:hypothetical protein
LIEQTWANQEAPVSLRSNEERPKLPTLKRHQHPQASDHIGDAALSDFGGTSKPISSGRDRLRPGTRGIATLIAAVTAPAISRTTRKDIGRGSEIEYQASKPGQTMKTKPARPPLIDYYEGQTRYRDSISLCS